MSEKLITFVVPCYNSQEYMKICIDSLLSAGGRAEILIVDEILSVGDAAFQEKSKHRMLELMGGGTTVLFVSHSLEQIREMCSRVVWLDHGTVKMDGDPQKVCDAYESGM